MPNRFNLGAFRRNSGVLVRLCLTDNNYMSVNTTSTLSFVLLCLLIVPGCARYEFDIVQPAGRAAHIGEKQDTQVQLDPLNYRFRAAEGRLVMQVYNPTPDPVQLMGERSYVVAPDGQSRPLKSMTIAPGSFIKIVLPPVRPVSYRSGPSFGIGVGTTIGRRHDDGFGFGGADYGTDPVYAYTEDDGGVVYWDWNGEGEARITLVYQRGSAGTFQDSWVFARKKM